MGVLLLTLCAALAGWAARGIAQEIADRISTSHEKIG